MFAEFYYHLIVKRHMLLSQQHAIKDSRILRKFTYFKANNSIKFVEHINELKRDF